jgi:RNA polymerase sigma-70 factor (ECF subfamily)
MEYDERAVDESLEPIKFKIKEEEITSLIVDRKEVLYKIAFMYLKNEEDTIEVVNETIFRAYKSFKKLKDPKLFNTWITRILINCANSHLKKRSKIFYIEDFLINIKLKDFQYEEINLEQHIDLYDAVDKLKGLCKTVIILKYFEDYTIDNIAKLLECSTSKVKNNLHKALTQLRFDLREGRMDEK